MAKRDVAGHDVTVDPPYVVGGGEGEKKLAAIFIDNEALEEDEDESEAGTQTVEDGPGEEGEDDNYSGIDEEFLDIEEDNGGLAVTAKTSTSVGKSGTSCEVLVPFSPDWDISAKEAIVKGDDSDNMLLGFQEESSPEIVNVHKEFSPSKLPNVSGMQKITPTPVYHKDLLPSQLDYTQKDVIIMPDSNFIKPRIRSSISIMPIETEWEHVTSMLSMVTGDVKLAFPTYSQGLVFGTIAVNFGQAGGAHLPVIEGLSSPKRGVSSNRNPKRSANLLKESLFANEIVPIYSTPKAGKLSWKDMTEWAQAENDPVVETPVCVIFTTTLYDPAGSNTADTISFNVQSVVILK
ncbi:hypothetical protein K439DRAFT_1622147 [Ramaria rubella]|nr:hypothetical protein K439DRAFT_1622147 [Ramaria rubella]